MRTVRTLLAFALTAVACRTGGPSGDPSAYVALPSDAGDASAAGGDDGREVDADLGQDTAVEASLIVQADAPADGLVDAPSDRGVGLEGEGSAGEGGDGGACVPPGTVPVCNPLTDTGCTLLQCDVDTTKTTPTGVCVLGPGLTPTAENAACTQTSGSTPCQADLSCVGGVCKRFCDSDCMGGECCSGTYGTTGFKLCGACQ